MYLNDKLQANKMLDFWSEKHNNDMMSVHYEITINILQNDKCRFSNDFITTIWSEFHKRFQ